MSIVPLLLFCSLVLVAGSVVLFIVSARQGDCNQSERMCLMPLEDDDPEPVGPPPPVAEQPTEDSRHS